jgi:hypothetical protein
MPSGSLISKRLRPRGEVARAVATLWPVRFAAGANGRDLPAGIWRKGLQLGESHAGHVMIHDACHVPNR